MSTLLSGLAATVTNVGQFAIISMAAVLSTPTMFNRDYVWIFYPLVGVVLTLPQLLSWRYFPRSPKYLYIHEAKPVEALKSLKWYRGEDVNSGREEA